jgi:hypothetical protein
LTITSIRPFSWEALVLFSVGQLAIGDVATRRRSALENADPIFVEEEPIGIIGPDA